jgi:putative transposase
MSSHHRRGYATLRAGRHSLVGRAYLVTFTTHHRARPFTNFAVACAACQAIEDVRLWTSSRLLAWVLMPDHWHGVLEVGPNDTLSSSVQRLKTNTARRIRLSHPDVGQVWSPGFHDHALCSDEAVEHSARYVVRNPIAAGLVLRAGDYPFWNLAWL